MVDWNGHDRTAGELEPVAGGGWRRERSYGAASVLPPRERDPSLLSDRTAHRKRLPKRRVELRIFGVRLNAESIQGLTEETACGGS
jgi:hypothetical protein